MKLLWTPVVATALTAVALAASPASAVDPIWTLPATDLSASGSNAMLPQVTSSADGTKLTAVWYRFNGSNQIVQASTSTNSGGTWSSPTNLSATGGNALAPQIASSADGTKLTAVWYRFNGSNQIVQASTSTNSGGTWSSPTDLSASGGDALAPQITSSADGTQLTVVWYRFNGSNYIVQTSTSTNSGGAWNTPVNLSTTGGNAANPQITSSADGTQLTAVWYRDNGSNFRVQATSSTNAGGAWSTPTNLSASGRNALDPQIASSSDGTTLTAVWRRSDGNNNIVQASTSTNSGGAWNTSVNVSTAGGDAINPQIRSSSDGSVVHTVWRRFDGNFYIVQAATSTDSGGAWSSPLDLSTADADTESPEITSSADGTQLTAVWKRIDGVEDVDGEVVVQATSSSDAGALWSTPSKLSAAGQSAAYPQVTSSNDGALVAAVWQRSNGSNKIVQAATATRPKPSPTPTPTPTVTPTPTPSPTPTPVKRSQKPLDAKGKPPARIKKSGLTVITGHNARTNAGQLIRTLVSGGTVAQGETRYFRIIRGQQGKVSIRTYGHSGLKITVLQRAPATSTYKAYRKHTVYINGVKQ